MSISPQTKGLSSYLSFKDLKQRISIEQVLRHYNLIETLQLKGKSHRGPCPFCETTEGNPFSVSLEKSCYLCFTCKASGNILDFVAKWEGVSIREAGQSLATNFAEEKDPRAATTSAEREAPPAQEAGPTAVPTPASAGRHPAGEDKAEERAEKSSRAEVPAASVPQGETPSHNEPLTFALKNIESDHPSVKALGIRDDILTSFGVGYYRGRGMMGNRIVIPIYNPDRQLIAYAGFHPEERTYTYPPKFRRELELHNLAGARDFAEEDHGLILVRHSLEALMLISAGHLNAVAILGETIREEQLARLLDAYGTGERVTLFWPTHADVVPTLSDLLPHFFVRLRRYEERGDTLLGFTAEDVPELPA